MEALGIDIKLIIAQIFNFLILFFVLKKVLYKPILKFLDQRQKKIEESLLNSEKITKELADIEQRKSKVLKDAQSEASKIISDQKKIADQEKEKIIEEARLRAAEEVRKGSLMAQQEVEKAKKELRREAVDIASDIAMKLFKNLPDTEKHKLIDEAVKE